MSETHTSNEQPKIHTFDKFPNLDLFAILCSDGRSAQFFRTRVDFEKHFNEHGKVVISLESSDVPNDIYFTHVIGYVNNVDELKKNFDDLFMLAQIMNNNSIKFLYNSKFKEVMLCDYGYNELVKRLEKNLSQV